jgi:hypothetical protein
VRLPVPSSAAGGTLFKGSTSDPIKYIYLNEVSTVATAFAFEGFTPTAPTTTTNATFIGSSSANLMGIANAALNAGMLYDINGSQVTTNYAGEGHIANPKTPNGKGIVPQNLINTLGNILAACVDSNTPPLWMPRQASQPSARPSLRPQPVTASPRATRVSASSPWTPRRPRSTSPKTPPATPPTPRLS